MRVLVTGGTGFLGSAIVRALASRGHQPIAFARSSPAGASGTATVRGDVRNRADLAAAVRGCDAVIHSAALVAVGRPRRADFDEINVGGLENVLALAASGQVRRIVYTSSFLALPPAGADQPVRLNDYQRTKVIADGVARAAAAAGAPIVTVYPGVIYGAGPLTEGNLLGRSIADHLARRLPGVIGADRTWSFAFVDDVAMGHVAALESGTIGARYHLGGENLPQMRPFEIVRERTGRRLPRRIPFAVAAALGLAEQARARVTASVPLLTLGTARILSHDWPLDSTLAVRDLGYQPRPLAQGLDSVLQALRPAG
ncbi:MAG: NAD-dependent epimerase/dehydratase family protein [Bacteroidales bacterium]